MKVVARLSVLFALCAPANAETAKDNTITKVVKILQGMLEKSKEEGEEEREVFAKFKCFCDDNEAEKKKSISDLAQEINVLTSKIQELQGSTGGLSSECAQLRSDMMANEEARASADSVRNKEHEDFVREEEDMVAGIDQMDEAITTLSEIGADQTLGSSAEHEQAMAGFEMMQKRASPKVREALDAVTLFLNPEQTKTVNAFLQAKTKAPFTGSYSSQSGQIVGILKSMRDTFKQNLAGARAAEAASVKAFDKLMDTLEKAYEEMSESYDTKQEGLGGNDDDLSAKKEQLAEAKAQKASDEEFLAKLLVMCEEKTKEYNERKALRANEDAAVAEAVSILNSDEAFAAFGKTDATSTGATGFLQLRSRRVRVHMHNASPVKAKLINVLKQVKTPRAQKILALVQAENPFEKVLGEIEKMLKLMEEEGKQDKENLDWCNAEREENHANLDDKINQIDTLNQEIEELTTTIEDPETGLKAQIKQTEESLVACVNSQKTETKERTAANLLYQQDIKNLVAAEEILAKAVKALRKYYDKLEERMAGYEFLQKEDPQAPETFGNYEGQSSKGGDAIEMLEFILEETKKEETEAHGDEENSQHNYEDSMADLKEEEADLEASLAELQKTLAAKEEELFQKKEEHKVTTADKEAIEEYLLKIKPGCDFITEHFEEREENRATETAAMENCIDLIKETPAYQNYKAEEHLEGFGDCKDKCEGNEDHVECKACMAKTSIPGYCAGHEGTPGC